MTDKKPSDKEVGAAVTLAVVLGVVKFHVDKAFDLAERAVVAMEKNANQTERLVNLLSDGSGADGNGVHAEIRVINLPRDL